MPHNQPGANADVHSTKSYNGRSFETDPERTTDVAMQSQCSDTKTSLEPVGDAENPPRNINGPRWGILVAGLVFANLLTSMDNTITADVQAPIILALGDFKDFLWISVGFELGAASAQLFWGQLYRLFNNKILFISAITIFEVGSAVCGSAKTLNAFIVGRLVCGLGGTGVFTGIMNIISALTTRAERALYVSFPGAAWAIGAIIGPFIGGGIASSGAGWRWCFYINLIAGGAWIPAYIFLLPSVPKMPEIPFMTRLRKLDGVGCFGQASFAVAQAKVAFIGCAQITGICVCFAIAYSIFLNTATNQIAAILPNATTYQIQRSILGVGSSIFSTLNQVQSSHVLEAVNNSIRHVWIQILAAGALSFALAVVMKRERILIKK